MVACRSNEGTWKFRNLANLMMQAALQRLALPLITGAEWAIFRGAHKSITQRNNRFIAWAFLDLQRPGDLVAWLAANA
jgi:hypothetical protein